MANPYYLAARGLEIAGDILRMGKAANIGERVASAAGKLSIEGTASAGREAVVGGANFGAKWAAKAKVGLEVLGSRTSYAFKKYAPGVKEAGGLGYQFFRHDPFGQRMAITGGAAALGYMSSPSDATRGEKFGRAVGFGLLANYGFSRFSNPGNVEHLATGFRRLEGKENIFPLNIGEKAPLTGWRGAAQEWGKGFGMPSKWGAAHSIGAGAMYGLLSTHTSIAEGAIFGGIAHLGAKGLGKSWSRTAAGFQSEYGPLAEGVVENPLSRLNGLRKAQGMRAAFKAAPIIRTAALVGGIRGAYNSMGTGDMTGLNVAGGALRGMVGGAALGTGAKMMANHPWITIGTVGPSMMVMGDAMTAAGTVAQAGAPGFDTMNADGDLALSLHRMRHG